MRALISVYDKRGLETLAMGLAELGCELVASGGTAATLETLGLEVTRVEDVTSAPEMLGGRVKTLHPRIHGGILARRDREDDLAAAQHLRRARHVLDPCHLEAEGLERREIGRASCRERV